MRRRAPAPREHFRVQIAQDSRYKTRASPNRSANSLILLLVSVTIKRIIERRSSKRFCYLKGVMFVQSECLGFIFFFIFFKKTFFEWVVTSADQNDVTVKLDRDATICESSENDACFSLCRAAWVMQGVTLDSIPLRGSQLVHGNL